MNEPLLAAAPSMVDPRNGTRVWLFDEHATIVDQTVGPLTKSVVEFLTTEVEAQLQQRWVSQKRKITYLHDWRNSASYESAGRELLLQWGRQSLGHAQKVWVQIAADAPAFVRIATRTGIGALKLVRMPVDHTDDLSPQLEPLRKLIPVRVG